MKKTTITKAKKKAWEWMSKYIRLRDRINETHAMCITCKKLYPVNGVGCIQAGHFVGGRSNSVLYEERNVHTQCMPCNVHKNGAWEDYYEFMIAKYGAEEVDRLLRLRNVVIPMTPQEHLEKAEYFKSKCDALGGWK